MNNQNIETILTGIYGLDKLLGGLRPGTLNVIAARPGMGKTSLAVQIAYNMAYSGKRVAFFSLEMSEKYIKDRIHKAFGKNNELPIDIYDNGFVSAGYICEKVKTLGSVDAVFIDYLQLMRPKTVAPGKEYAKYVEESLRELKALAESEQMPIVITVQVFKATNREHRLSQLNIAEIIDQKAETIIFPFRPSFSSEFSGESDQDELIVEGNKHGETGVVSVHWNNQKCIFEE